MPSFDDILTARIDMNGFVDHPILSHIVDNLYVGMSPYYWASFTNDSQKTAHKDFKYIFNYFPFKGFEYPLHSKQKMMAHKCFDSNSEYIDLNLLKKHAKAISAALAKDVPVLIHCQMGINRSSFFAACGLIHHYGIKPQEAIALLRKQRSPYVLINKCFEEQLYNHFG